MATDSTASDIQEDIPDALKLARELVDALRNAETCEELEDVMANLIDAHELLTQVTDAMRAHWEKHGPK